MVRDLKKLKYVYLFIKNMCMKSEKEEGLQEDLEEVRESLNEAIGEFCLQ